MNWRLLTTINAAIALITVSSVIYVVNRPRAERTRATAVRSAPTNEEKQTADREAKARVEALNDLSQARVDDLGSVPAAELTHLMDRATPEQLAALALKFNDAPTDARTFGGMGVFFQAWTQLDPQGALIGAFRINDVQMRKLAAVTVVNSVSPSAAPELIAYLSEHPDKDLSVECKEKFLDPLISSWSLLDPEAASKYMDELGDTKNSLNYQARSDIAYNWATLDPKAALGWMETQKGKGFVNTGSLYDQIVRGWCRKDIGAASAYVAQHLDDPAAERAASSVAEEMFTNDPKDATSWLSQMPEGQPRSSAESTVASMWTQKDPAEAAKWLGTLPENEQRDLAQTIAQIWIGKSFSEASRWIESLTGDVRDNALTAVVYRDGATEIESLSLALSIRNPEIQNDTIQNVIRNWSYNDPRAAETWVKGSPLSAEQQAQLLTVISDSQQATEATAERVIIDH
jgi:hypothetical protein